MRLEFSYTADDLAEAAKALGKAPATKPGRGTLWRGVFGWLLFIGLAVALFAQSFLRSRRRPVATTLPRPNALGWLMPLVPWLLVFGFIWFFVFRALRGRFNQMLEENPDLAQLQTLDVDEDGVRLSTPLATTAWKWPNFVDVLETRNLLLLRMSNQSSLIVPKRVAEGETGLRELRALLANHVAAPTGAFPVLPVQRQKDADEGPAT